MEVDHVVVGAGVVGCGVAWHLARRGRDVLVIDGGPVAGAASGGIGMRGVRANGRDPRELQLAKLADELWPDLADAIGHPTGYRRTGHLHLSEQASDRPALVAQVERQLAAGIASELLDRDRLDELEPGLAPCVVAAVHCPGDGVADHTATTRGLALAAAAAGAEVREGMTAAGLGRSGGRVRIDVAEGEAVFARQAVICANAGTADLLAPHGPPLPLVTVWPQVLVTAPLDEVPVRHLVGHASRRLALKALPDGSVMISGGWLGTDGTVDPDAVAGNLLDAAAVYPALEGVEVRAAVADRPESASFDLVPIVDEVPGIDGALVAAGWSGHGWAIAPAVASLLADWVTTGARPPLLEGFGLDRFAR